MLVYIEHKGKVKKIPKPPSFRDLRDKFAEKFELPVLEHSHIFYLDGQSDEITIIDDEDYAISLDKPAPGLKFCLRFEELPKTAKGSRPVLKSDLESYAQFLEANLPTKQLEKVEGLLSQEYIPCYECFEFRVQGPPDEWVDERQCGKCNGTGKLPRRKMWSMILSLIEYKIRQFVVLPARTQLASAQGEGTNHSNEKSMISDMPPMGEEGLGLDILNSLKKVPELSGHPGMPRLSLLQARTDPKLEFQIRDNHSVQEKTSKPGIHKSEVMSLLKKEAQDEENYEKRKLEFCLGYSRAVFRKGVVTVTLRIENNRTASWPDGVNIRGDKSCELTRSLVIRQTVSLGSVETRDVEFSFPLSEAALHKDKNSLIFQFFSIDNKIQIFYSSIPFKIKLEKDMS